MIGDLLTVITVLFVFGLAYAVTLARIIVREDRERHR